jgi:conjugal transfer/type IV secretion protein DotA/TraY
MRVGDEGKADTFGNATGINNLFASDSHFQNFIMNVVALNPSQMNGIQEMVNFGDIVIGASEAILATYVAASAIFSLSRYVTPIKGIRQMSKFMGKLVPSGAVSNALTFSQLFFGGVALSIFMSGVYDALILPLLPFIHFTFAAMGIFILVIEGVVAAPIWALMHVRMAGKHVISEQTRTGYILFFNILLRIPLTFFGLLFSIIVFNGMVAVMNATLFPALASATAESLFGLVSTATIVVLITILNYQIARRSFQLITQIPDRVTMWFGASNVSGDETGRGENVISEVHRGSHHAIGQAKEAATGAFISGKSSGGGLISGPNPTNTIGNSGE